MVILAIIAAVGFFALTSHAEIPAEEASAHSQFDAQLIAHGESFGLGRQLHRLSYRPRQTGFCRRTSAIPTPFGTLYSTNITPDPETRHRPLERGGLSIARHARRRRSRGKQPLPGLSVRPFHPCDGRGQSRALCLSDDARLYAPLPRQTTLPFPLTLRPLLAGWKLLFFREGTFRRIRLRATPGTVAPILPKASAIAAHAARRATVSAPRMRGRHFAGGEAERLACVCDQRCFGRTHPLG